MELEHSIASYPKNKRNSKWFKDLNIRHDTIKLLEDNIGKRFFNINCSNIFLDLSSKAKEINAKINNWDLIKLKSFCPAKENINKMKRQPTECQEDICKPWYQQGANFQNIQTAHTTQYQKDKQPNQKMGRRPK